MFGDERYGFGSLADRSVRPTPLQNPTKAEIVAQLEGASGISNDTELLIFFVGHSVSEGADDIQLILGQSKDGNDRTIQLRWLLQTISHEHIRKLVVILDTCHAGRTAQQFRGASGQWFAMLATDDGYAFDAAFSDAVLRALEAPIRRNDQRLDRRHGGMTYNKVFENARGRIVNTSTEGRPSQDPRSSGDYGITLLLPAPRRVPDGFNVFASSRSIYGRVFRLLQIIQNGPHSVDELRAATRSDSTFLLQRSEGASKYVSTERLGEYLEFLRKAGFINQPGGRIQMTEVGLRASDHRRFNTEVMAAIEARVLTDGVTYEFLNEVVMQLLSDMIPPTPINIQQRAAMLGRLLRLDIPTRLALLLLPSTGQFLKGSADAIFPAELG
ncbi:caspase family protein [Devosia sp.]|uniref:caspase family protein n=1 Tax=Devosia sp. TaxID=1871048 RepID=UPI0026039E82|nr:caspase family protein [Devosia sp.]